MKTTPRILVLLGALGAFSASPFLLAQETPPAAPQKAPLSAKAARARERSSHDSEIVSVLSDILVPEGGNADTAVAIAGNVRADGSVRQAVAIGGSVTANANVGQTVSIVGSSTLNAGARQAVAIIGNVHVNSHVRGEVVAIGGGVELAPNARVEGTVVALGGGIKRADSASIAGQVVEFKMFKGLGGFSAWVAKALAKGRLLAFSPDLGWAWAVAGVFLVCHLLTTLFFPKAVAAGAGVLEQRPGGTFLAALLAAIISPLLGVLLAVTVVGPFVWLLASIALSLVGKAAFLAWLGRRAALPLGIAHPVPAVLLGGMALMLAYCVPVLGLLLWKLSGFIGAGMAAYAAVLALRRRRAGRAAALAAEKAALDAATPPAPATSQADAIAPRAGFWARAAALLIDFAMITFVTKICHAVFALLPLFALYCVVLWALRGTTVGGIVCGLRIARLDGRPVDWPTAIVRALGGFLSMLPAGLGFIWAAFDDESQSWHDKIAGTVVIRSPKGQSLI